MIIEKVAQALIRITALKIFKNINSKNQNGFTLVEVMVVLVIVAGLLGLALNRLKSGGTSFRSSLLKIGNLTKNLRSTAQLTNTTYRLAINLDNPDSSEPKQSYWIENSTKVGVFFSDQSTLSPEEILEMKKNKEELPPPEFTRNYKIIKEVELPEGLFFNDIEVKGEDKAYESGMAYIYFLPQGLVDEAILHFKTYNDKKFTLSIHPLTGHVDIAVGHITLRQTQQ